MEKQVLQKVYFFSGLGADHTVFQFLELTYCTPVFVEWIQPLKRESVAEYALRIKSFHKIPDDATIVGQSFGGIVATEIARAFPETKIILLSSAKSFSELPPFYSKGKYFSIHSIVPDFIHKIFLLKLKKRFGLKTPEYIKVYETIVSKSDFRFNNWAVSALLRWENNPIPANIIHIHGAADKVFPYKFVKCDITVKEGGHLMVMEQANVVSQHLRNIISLQLLSSDG